MSFLKQLFGLEDRRAVEASRMFSEYPPNQATGRTTSAEQAAIRRELLRNVLRKTLHRHGIPTEWIGAEMLVATSRGRETGMHWRLLIKHWDPRLLTHAVALQNSLIVRLLSFDPLAADWLMGISWQFALPYEAACPAMPYPGFWTAEPAIDPEDEAELAVMAGARDPAAAAAQAAAPAGGDSTDSVRSDLDKLLAIRDTELARDQKRSRAGSLEKTQPMYLKTEPAPLLLDPMRLL